MATDEEKSTDYLVQLVHKEIWDERKAIQKLSKQSPRTVAELWPIVRTLILLMGGTVLKLLQELGAFTVEIRDFALSFQGEVGKVLDDIDSRLLEIESGEFAVSEEELGALKELLETCKRLSEKCEGDEKAKVMSLVSRCSLIVETIPVADEEEPDEEESDTEDNAESEEPESKKQLH